MSEFLDALVNELGSSVIPEFQEVLLNQNIALVIVHRTSPGYFKALVEAIDSGTAGDSPSPSGLVVCIRNRGSIQGADKFPRDHVLVEVSVGEETKVCSFPVPPKIIDALFCEGVESLEWFLTKKWPNLNIGLVLVHQTSAQYQTIVENGGTPIANSKWALMTQLRESIPGADKFPRDHLVAMVLVAEDAKVYGLSVPVIN